MKKTWLILMAIIILAAVLRLWGIGNIPASPDWDEAALGYNAYSILHTGKDEYGAVLPLILRSFNDYKPGLYSYLIIPFLFLFDLSLLAVRLPSALFGILTVIGLFLLVKDLFRNTALALLTAFLLAISPWHIQFSRAAFEANVGLAFAVFTVLFFRYGLKRPWLLSVASIFAALNLYVYQSEKAFMPLLVLLLLGIFWRTLLELPKKYLVGACIIGFVLALPFIMSIFSGQAFVRANGTTIFRERTNDTERYQKRIAYSTEHHLSLGLIMNNRRLVYGKEVLTGYLSHYNLNWLFISGDNPRHHAPNMGLLYLWELPFLLIGIYSLLFYKRGNEKFFKAKLLVFGWLLITPLPAAVTIDTPHAVRTLAMVAMLELCVAAGILSSVNFLKRWKKWHASMVFLVVLLFVGLFNFLYFLDQYFIQYKHATGTNWEYSYGEVIQQVQAKQVDYKKIVISNKYPLDQSYMYFLFYLKYPPEKYQQEVKQYLKRDDVRGFDKFEFRPIGNFDAAERTLYIFEGDRDMPPNVHKIFAVKSANGETFIHAGEWCAFQCPFFSE